ncbi:MAG: hypothetical protein AAGH65_11325, partial [Pseudomonadota bacterium]
MAEFRVGSIVLSCALCCAVAWVHAGQDEVLYNDGFELQNRFVDVSATTNRLCVIDTVGNLRCVEAPWLDTLPDQVEGDYIDLALAEFGVCARTADDRIDCFGEAPLQPDAAFETAIAGTAGFLPDLPASLCAPNGAGSTVVCIGQSPPPGVDVLDVAAADLSSDSDAFCWAPATGGIDCTLDGGSVTSGSGITFVDIAVGGSDTQEVACGLDGDGKPACFDLAAGGLPDPILENTPTALTEIHGNDFGSFCGLEASGQMVCWVTQSLNVPGNSLPQVRGTAAGLSSIESLFESDIGCGIGLEQKIQCWGGIFAGAGLPPPGLGWTNVDSIQGATSWTHPARPGWTAGLFTDQTRSTQGFVEPGFSFLSDGLAVCGLRDGEFRCIEGTDRWGVPEGPWLDVVVSLGDAVAWCGIRDTGALECESRVPGSLLSEVPAGTYQRVSLDYAFFQPNPEEFAVALADDGSLVCWSASGPCNAPAGNDFVHLTGVSTGAPLALRSDGQVINTVTNELFASSEVYERYRGSVGFRADN